MVPDLWEAVLRASGPAEIPPVPLPLSEKIFSGTAIPADIGTVSRVLGVVSMGVPGSISLNYREVS